MGFFSNAYKQITSNLNADLGLNNIQPGGSILGNLARVAQGVVGNSASTLGSWATTAATPLAGAFNALAVPTSSPDYAYSTQYPFGSANRIPGQAPMNPPSIGNPPTGNIPGVTMPTPAQIAASQALQAKSSIPAGQPGSPFAGPPTPAATMAAQAQDYAANGPGQTPAPVGSNNPTLNTPTFQASSVPQGGPVNMNIPAGQAGSPFSLAPSVDANGNPLPVGSSNTYQPGSAPVTGSVSLGSATDPIPSSALAAPTTDSQLGNLLDQNQALRQQVLNGTAIPASEQQLMQQATEASTAANELNTQVLGADANIMDKPIALNFQQGQEAAITRDSAFQASALANESQAASAELANAQQVRQANTAQALQALGFSQQDIQNYFQQEQVANAQTQVIQSGGNYLRYTFDSNGNPTGIQNLGPIQPNLTPFTDLTTGGTSFFNSANGQVVNPNDLEAAQQSGAAPAAGGSQSIPGVVAGYDLGAGIVMGPYANATGSDKTNYTYASKIGSLASAMPTFNTAADVQQYVQQAEPNSPITGQMIAQASNQYGVPAQLLTAVMQQESSLGTAGKGAKTFNPGNVGNTNSGATQNFGSWQAGVNAVAQNLAKRQMSQSQIQSAVPQAQATTPQGQLQSAISSYAPLIAPYAQALPNIPGAAYVDADKVPSNLQPTVQQQAAKFNQSLSEGGSSLSVPYLQSAQVSAVKGIDSTVASLNSLQELIPSVNGSGFFGGTIGSSIANEFGKITQTNQSVISYDQYRTTAIGYLKSVAGGAGSGLRINETEINAAIDNLPTIHDNAQTAATKMAAVYSHLNNALGELIPGASIPGSSGSPPQTANAATEAYLQALGIQ